MDKHFQESTNCVYINFIRKLGTYVKIYIVKYARPLQIKRALNKILNFSPSEPQGKLYREINF